jgi:hypothetical protein
MTMICPKTMFIYIQVFKRTVFLETKKFPAWPNLSLSFKCNSMMIERLDVILSSTKREDTIY